jgi:hypothetical protein
LLLLLVIIACKNSVVSVIGAAVDILAVGFGATLEKIE